ncbi:MAG TPA: lysophospholipid acyltransferase family protein [Holophaga sp.]|nr:lysophospholipid acyltransferase family protein [Holophaga sp.]
MARFRNSWIVGILMVAWGLFALGLTGLCIVIAAPFMGGKRAFFSIGPRWARHLFRLCGVPLRVRGWEALPEDIRAERRPVIFMSNHESNLDPPVLIAAIPIPAVYISKKELKWVPLVGWAAQLGGVIFIDRSNRERAIHSIQKAAQEIRDGKSVVIFPEGTRTRTGALGRFKKGGFAMALDAGVPIVPLATVGGFTVMPPGTIRIHEGTYTLAFGSPVDPAEFSDRDALMHEVETRIARLVQEVRSQDAEAPSKRSEADPLQGDANALGVGVPDR